MRGFCSYLIFHISKIKIKIKSKWRLQTKPFLIGDGFSKTQKPLFLHIFLIASPAGRWIGGGSTTSVPSFSSGCTSECKYNLHPLLLWYIVSNSAIWRCIIENIIVIYLMKTVFIVRNLFFFWKLPHPAHPKVNVLDSSAVHRSDLCLQDPFNWNIHIFPNSKLLCHMSLLLMSFTTILQSSLLNW